MARSHKKGFHPLLWWLWAVFLSAILFVVAHPAIAATIVIASIIVVRAFRSNTYWYQTFNWALKFAALAFCIRIAIGFIIGVPMPGRVLFVLPQIQLPDYLVGIRLGGPVTSQRLGSALEEALMLVALIVIFAAANSLSNPHNLLRVLPKRFYGIGLASVIASSVAPQTAKSIVRVRSAKRLRGQRAHGIRSWRNVAMPVLEDSLERSIDLAASLESRGYGYFPSPTRYRPERWERRDLLALSGPIYALILVLVLSDLAPIVSALAILILTITPVFAS